MSCVLCVVGGSGCLQYVYVCVYGVGIWIDDCHCIPLFLFFSGCILELTYYGKKGIFLMEVRVE